MKSKLKISDAGIAQHVAPIRAKSARDAGYAAGVDVITQLLAKVADRWDLPVSDAKARFQTLTRGEQIALTRQGMSDDERQDLKKAFFSDELSLTPEARQLLADVLDIPLQLIDSNPALKRAWLALNDQGKVVLGGVNPSNQGEVIRLSGTTFEGQSGIQPVPGDSNRFVSELGSVQPGDWIKSHTTPFGNQAANTGHSNWLTVRVNVGKDTTNAAARLGLLRLAPSSDGFTLSSASAGSRVSEPLATLAFVNTRTQQRTLVKLDAQGRLPTTTLPGQAGDSFSVRISDGVNDKGLRKEVGKIALETQKNNEIPLPQSVVTNLSKKDKSERSPEIRLNGTLFPPGGPSEKHVFQGGLGDCWLNAAAAAIALKHPEILQQMIRDNGNGTYTVTLHEYNDTTGAYAPVEITVDDRVRQQGASPLFGRGPLGEDGKTIVWWPILEKAFAEFYAGYANIDGNWMMFSLETLLGREVNRQIFKVGQDDEAWDFLKKLTKGDNVMTAATVVDTNDKALMAKMKEYGYVSNHAYTLERIENKNGKKLVWLRNPWGYFEGNRRPDKVEDGSFAVPLADFVKFFPEVEWANMGGSAKAE